MAMRVHQQKHTARRLWEEFYYFLVNWSCRFAENLFAFAGIWALNLASPCVCCVWRHWRAGATSPRPTPLPSSLRVWRDATRCARSVRIVLLTPVDAFVLCSSQLLEAPIQDPEEERRRPATHDRGCRVDAQDEQQQGDGPAKRQNSIQGLPQSGAALVLFLFS